METIRVTTQQLSPRLDPLSYRGKYLSNEARLLRSGFPLSTLKSVCTQFETGISNKTPGGYRLLKTRNVKYSEVVFDDFDEEVNAPTNLILRADDILLTTYGTGSIGKVAFIGVHPPPATVDYTIAVIRPNIDPAYLSAFLTSSFGQLQIEKHTKGTTGITFVLKSDISSILIPDIDASAQLYIGEKVRQAERLRERARCTEQEVLSRFDFLTSNLMPHRKSWRADSRQVYPYRINPKHYDPVVLSALADAKTSVRLVALDTIIGPRSIAGGATPIGASYPASGVFFVRVQNVLPLRLDLSDAAYLDDEQDTQIARSRCQANDIIFTITGYPGVAALVSTEDLPVNINQHSVRFDTKGAWPAEYVAAALNSKFVKLQVDRLAIGGTRDALDYVSVRSLLVPALPDDVIATTVNEVRFMNIAYRCASRLTAGAKLLVEALIEGRVAEAELSEAQEALERGDASADRKLLSRLTRKGIDVAGEPPLFPDLDALYETLEQASEGAMA